VGERVDRIGKLTRLRSNYGMRLSSTLAFHSTKEANAYYNLARLRVKAIRFAKEALKKLAESM